MINRIAICLHYFDEVVIEKTRTAWVAATFFGVGLMGLGPGTWASAITVVLWWWGARFIPVFWVWPTSLVVCVVVTAVGIPASTIVARESLTHDPGFVVIDEVAGQMIPLIGCPLGWKYLLASLLLFRAFDILKPPPLRRLEELPGGTGIMADDLGAGFYSWLVLHAAISLGF